METMTQHFWTNYLIEDSFWEKIMPTDQIILKTLAKLQIENYASCLQLTVFLIALSPESFKREEKLLFRKKIQEIEIYINLDYEKLLVSTETETLQLIAQTYLLAIERFLMKRKDFDAKKFYTDVEKLFRENGVL